MFKKLTRLSVLCAVSALAFLQIPAIAKKSHVLPAEVSMAVFPIERGYDGAQFVITPKGYKVMVPGMGISPDAREVSVYRDPKNNYWYIDQQGQPTKFSSDQVKWAMTQIQTQQAAAQQGNGFAQSAPAQVTNVYNTSVQESSGGSGVGSALVTGVAAAGGAAVGAALSNAAYNNRSYYGVPYGTPLYRGNGNRAYYAGANGNRVYVSNNHAIHSEWDHQRNWNDLNGNQKATLYNAHKINHTNGVSHAYSGSRTRSVSRSGGFANVNRSVSRSASRSFSRRR